MTTALAKLLQIVPPPERSPYTPIDWLEAEQLIGTKLPSDRYGSGELAGFIRVRNPFPEPEKWVADINVQLQADREARENCPEGYAGPIFPEPEGRLPWGDTGNGDVLWWLTKGPAAQWTVILWESRMPDHQHFPLPTVEFLVAWVTGALDLRVSTDHFIKQTGPTFMPD